MHGSVPRSQGGNDPSLKVNVCAFRFRVDPSTNRNPKFKFAACEFTRLCARPRPAQLPAWPSRAEPSDRAARPIHEQRDVAHSERAGSRVSARARRAWPKLACHNPSQLPGKAPHFSQAERARGAGCSESSAVHPSARNLELFPTISRVPHCADLQYRDRQASRRGRTTLLFQPLSARLSPGLPGLPGLLQASRLRKFSLGSAVGSPGSPGSPGHATWSRTRLPRSAKCEGTSPAACRRSPGL
jgi:hypothetical protein